MYLANEGTTAMKIQFNTGRLYQADGQRIVAAQEGTTVRFHDISRMIEGEFDLIRPARDRYELEQLVMTHYDFGQYRGAHSTGLRWEDA
jgi:hypothetical protein